MEGPKLIRTIVKGTGLPEERLNEELIRLIERAGLDPETIGLQEVRVILAEYLQEVMLSAKENLVS